MISRRSCLFTENTARANTHPRDMGTHRFVGIDAHTMDDRVGGISQKSQGLRHKLFFLAKLPHKENTSVASHICAKHSTKNKPGRVDQ